MKKVIIEEGQKGLLFKNGKLVKALDAGKYLCFGGKEIEVRPLEQTLVSAHCPLDVLLANPEVAAQVTVVEVGDKQLALAYRNGQFSSVLRPGKYAYWNCAVERTFKLIDVTSPEVDESVPTYIFSHIPQYLYHKIEVASYQKALLFFDRKPIRILDCGVYYFWNTDVKVEAEYVDTRLTQMDLLGQEMLTADKVTLRINFVCRYRVTDCEKILSELDNFSEQLHVTAQLILREYIGGCRLDEILENKERMSQYVFEKLKEKEAGLFIRIEDAGIKDIILPGEIREIMNTVLIAEKRAQANVITRREEVASTRSLLNTAKLMDENQTLCRLKELEYLERIFEHVGSLNISTGDDPISRLTDLLSAKKAST